MHLVGSSSPFVAFSQACSTKANKDSLKRLARARVIGPMGSSRESHLMLARRRSCLGLVIKNSNKEVLGSRMILNNNVPKAFTTEVLVSTQAIQIGLDLRIPSVNLVTHILVIEGMRRERFTYLDDGVPIGTLVHPMKTKDNSCETDGAIVYPFQAATNLYVIHL
ncbi:hypothetical protein Goari_002576, partial [Gossypium aridum]|nr:hypothetical protein [Gossypium aridum]